MRSSAGCSTASVKICSRRCQRSVGMGRRQRSIQPGPCKAQSVWTVRTEIPSASAVSSTDRPPKKRSSTTCALRGSSTASNCKAPINGEQVGCRFAGRDVDATEWQMNRARASSPLGATAARDIDEHVAHHARGDPEEMSAILPADWIPPEQTHAHLVDECGGLKADGRSLADQVPRRHPMQFLVDERQHAVECVRIPLAPGAEQLGDLAVGLSVWSDAHGAETRLAEHTGPARAMRTDGPCSRHL